MKQTKVEKFFSKWGVRSVRGFVQQAISSARIGSLTSEIEQELDELLSDLESLLKEIKGKM